MKQNRLWSILFISLIFISFTTCLGQHAIFQGLGDFPGGSFESGASAVSADGSVVVGYGTTASGQQAFRWTKNTGMVSLGNLPDSSFKKNWVNGISADGTVIVGSGDPGSGRNSYQGFRWTQDSGMVLTGSLDGSARYEAWGVSADGSVIVGDGGLQGFRWTKNGGIEGIGVLLGRNRGRAVAVSADGSVAVGSSYTVSWNQEQAFLWTKVEGIVGLGFLPGSNYSFPNAVSPDGSVIVGTSSASSGYPAFRWTQATGMVNIGHLPGKQTTHPFCVSLHGKIIVGGSFNSPTDGRAFIWDSTHGMRDLQNVLQSDYGLNLTGWQLNSAFGITPDGNVIVGAGINPSGLQEAFRVVLDTLLRKYKIVDLGTLGGSSSWAFGMNSSGQVVGSSFPRGTTTTINPFLYSNGRMTNLNTAGGWATGINDNGQIVGTGVVGGNSHAFMYSNGQTSDLGTLGGIYSEGWGINIKGQAVGHADISRTLTYHHAVLYNHGVNTDLGTLGGTSSMANALNDAGQIVGEAKLSGDSISHAFLYVNGQMTDLGTLGGHTSSAGAINASGQIVGSADMIGGVSHAFLYYNGVMTDLGTLGGVSSSANGINDYGQVVGSAGINDTVGHAFIYSDGRMTDLNNLIDPASGWMLNWAVSINNKGQIAGNGIINGQSHAFLMTPDTASTSGIHENTGKEMIDNFELGQNFPNPFNPTTNIQYTLNHASRVTLIVYNLLGQKIKTLVDSVQSAGEHSITWDATDSVSTPVASGIYFYRMESNGTSFQKKMILIR